MERLERWKRFVREQCAAHPASAAPGQAVALVNRYFHTFAVPADAEERLLVHLWDAADETEQHVIAQLMIRLAEDDNGSSSR